MVVNTKATFAIPGSPWKMIGLGLLGLGVTAVSLAVAVPPFGASNIVMWVVGVVGALFFGLCTVLIFWRAITSTGSVVTLSRTGIRDIRVAAKEIPWSAIRDISTWSYQGQKFMVLDVDPDVEARLDVAMISRMTRGANRSLGADGLCVGAQGLAVSYDALLAMTLAYAEAHGPRGRGPEAHAVRPIGRDA